MERHEGDLERLARKQRENHKQQGQQQQGQQQQGQQQQQQQRTGAAVLPPPSEPMQVAREFVELHCRHNGSVNALTLRYWHGGWWAWRRSHWVEVENRTVRALLYAFTADASYM